MQAAVHRVCGEPPDPGERPYPEPAHGRARPGPAGRGGAPRAHAPAGRAAAGFPPALGQRS